MIAKVIEIVNLHDQSVAFPQPTNQSVVVALSHKNHENSTKQSLRSPKHLELIKKIQ